MKVSGHLSSNSGEIVLQWALEGKGIMLRSEWDVLPFLESGKLVQYCRSMHKAPISGLFTGSRSIAA